jgi:hypothetical protein
MLAAAARVLLHVAVVEGTTGYVCLGWGRGRERIVTDAPPPTAAPDKRGLGVSVAFPVYEDDEPESTSAWQPLWSGLG